jgi:post-segregation antitoxin (ccd killing protein)
MRNRFDHLGKQIGQAALGPSGATVVHAEISPETQYADLHHDPDPARTAERARLGLLGRIASRRCMIELYGHAPNAAELRACLVKHLAAWQQQARATRSRRRRKPRPVRFVEPSLWIVCAGTPTTLLAKLKLEPAPRWPTGVYQFGDDVLRVRFVVASELPRERSTLILRLMAAGRLLPQAIAELRELPKHAHERVVARPALLRLHHALVAQPSRKSQEKELIVAVRDVFEVLEEKGRKEGRKEARVETLADALLTVLQERGIRVSEAARKRIRNEQDAKRLQRWLKRAVVAKSVTAVFDERN